jgi:osmotically-inducible protein OsmY
MNKLWIAATGVAAGALVMFFTDPHSGRRRRARVRDAARHTSNTMLGGCGRVSRNAANRITGVSARLSAAIEGDIPVSDEVLIGRVRSKIGRLVSHPHAVAVAASAGRVTVSGPVLTHEAHQLLKGIAAVRGVKDVNDQLERHDSAEHVPALQGGQEPAPAAV